MAVVLLFVGDPSLGTHVLADSSSYENNGWIAEVYGSLGISRSNLATPRVYLSNSAVDYTVFGTFPAAAQYGLTGPFTIELTHEPGFYLEEASSAALLLGCYGAGSPANPGDWALWYRTGPDRLEFTIGSVTVSYNITFSISEYQIAITRDASGYIRLFLDGALVDTSIDTATAPLTISQPITIGGRAGLGDVFADGFYSQLRISDEGLYTSDYTPVEIAAEPISIPDSLPPFASTQHMIEQKGPFVNSAMAQGHARKRRKWRSTPPIRTITWELSQAQMTVLDNWYENTLRAGSLPFQAPLAKQGVGLITKSVQWIEPYVATPNEIERWTVTGKLLVDAAARFSGVTRRISRNLTDSVHEYLNAVDWSLAAWPVARTESMSAADASDAVTTQVYAVNEVLALTDTANAGSSVAAVVEALAAASTQNSVIPFPVARVESVTAVDASDWAFVSGADPFYEYVVLSLHLNGTNGSTTYTDSSVYGHSVTGISSSLTTATKKFGTAALNVNGGWITTATAAELKMNTNAFTGEAWIYVNTNTGGSAYAGVGVIFGQENETSTTGRWFFGLTRTVDTAGPARLVLLYNGSMVLTGTTQLTTGTWHHVAISKTGNGGATRLFLDGVQEASMVDSNDYSAAIDWRIGASGSGASFIDGYLDDVRITKGIARYTSTFTPPTLQNPDTGGALELLVLLHGDGTNGSSTVIDSGPYHRTIGKVGTPGGGFISTAQSLAGGSSLYTGSGYYGLYFDWVADVQLADFTLEFWFYRTGTDEQGFVYWNNGNSIIQLKTPGNGGSYELMYVGNSSIHGATTATFPLNTWTHAAIVGTRINSSQSTWKFYINGTLSLTLTEGPFALSDNPTLTTQIGETSYTAFTGINGYIEDWALYKGAKYSGNFTPAVIGSTDTDFAKVKLLMLMSGTDGSTTFTDSSNTGAVYTAYGDAQIDTADYKFAPSSALFDGTGDYLAKTGSTELNCGTSDFCLEAFFKITTAVPSGKLYTIFTTRASSSSDYGIQLALDITGSIYATTWGPIAGTSMGACSAPASTVSTGSWHHVAFERVGATFTLYYDGTSVASYTNSAAVVDGGNPFIGKDPSNGTRDFNGWIQSIRFTIGAARYAGNFTPPTVQFPTS